MQDAIKKTAENLLLTAMETELDLIEGGELSGKILADAVDDAMSRSLAVLQLSSGSAAAVPSIRVILPENAEELMG